MNPSKLDNIELVKPMYTTYTGEASSLAVMRDLDSFFIPHVGQIPAVQRFFKGCRKFFFACGRKYGKTEIILFFLFLSALTTPNGAYYYIAPFAKQAREIIWASNRLQNFLPAKLRDKYIIKINHSEMRIWFKNGSFIKLDGADNFSGYDGITPHGIVYDEFRDHHPEFHNRMDPNLAVHNAWLLIVGSIDKKPKSNYWKMHDLWVDDPNAMVVNLPSWSNPHISKRWLREKRLELIKSNQEDVWLSEYAAKRCKGGARFVFYPLMTSKNTAVLYSDMVIEMNKRRKFLRYQVICDPAGASTFGVIIRAYDPWTKQIWVLDEIYEQRQTHMTAKQLWIQICEVVERNSLEKYSDKFEYIYDEAETWFANEMVQEYGVNFLPSWKSSRSINEGISLMKEQLRDNLVKISASCKNLMDEMENFMVNDKAKFEGADHLIDCMRYGDNHAMMSTKEETREEKEEKEYRELPMRYSKDYDPEVDDDDINDTLNSMIA